MRKTEKVNCDLCGLPIIKRLWGVCMGNMDYCRFRNTKEDVAQCIEGIDNRDIYSEDEALAGKRMFKEFLDYCRNQGIIESYDQNLVDEIIGNAVLPEDDDDE